MPLQVILVGFDDRDQRYFRSVLELIEGRLGERWLPVSRVGDRYDAMIIDVDSEEGRTLWERRPDAYPLAVAAARARDFACEWMLAKPFRPLGPHSIVETLNAIAPVIASRKPREASGDSTFGQTQRLAPLGGVTETVLKAVASGQPAKLVHGGDVAVLVDPQGRRYYRRISRERLDLLMKDRRAGTIAYEPCDRAEFETAIRDGELRPKPLERLLWLTFVLGHDVQPRGWAPEDGIRIRHWPDFASLPHNSNHLRLAAAFSRRPAAVADVAVTSRILQGEVIRFVNACAALGLVEAGAAPERAAAPRPAEEEGERAGLFRTILRRLSQLGAA